MGIIVESLVLKPPNDEAVKQFAAFFDLAASESKEDQKLKIPTHVLILSSLPTQWYDFFAGFSRGSRIPFLIYGQDAIAGISAEFASCYTFIKADMSLQTFFEAENEAFKRQEAAWEVIRAQETLLRMGVPVTAESLAQCVSDGRIREVSFFLAAGFSPDTRNNAGVPLLHVAARNGNREALRFLLMAGADLNLKSDDRGSSAVIDSVMRKQHDVLDDLIRAGADLNIQSKDGQTALVVAVGIGDERMVESLLRGKADPDISDSMGTSARKYAYLFHKSSITTLFDTLAPPPPPKAN
jgi:hypothetical protein